MNNNTLVNAKPVILIAALDWGLGHTTRCINIINKLLLLDCEVIIASEGHHQELLQKEFPNLNFVHLQGYRLTYGTSKFFTFCKIIMQIPKILIQIKNENKWLSKFIRDKHIDIVISDNRYGLFNHSIISVFITHQLGIKTGLGNMVNKITQKINYFFINKFNYCWIPDSQGQHNMGGELSHTSVMPLNKWRYINFLSRIKKQPIPITNKILVLLSGPEPQRTILEKKLLLQLQALSISVMFVRGLPASTNSIASTDKIKIFNHLSGIALEKCINESEIIISRSGYTTIMEVLPLNKKCIFIPTPGQTEQEYLAVYLSAKKWICSAAQDNFCISQLIKQAENLPENTHSFIESNNKLEEAILELLHAIK